MIVAARFDGMVAVHEQKIEIAECAGEVARIAPGDLNAVGQPEPGEIAFEAVD